MEDGPAVRPGTERLVWALATLPRGSKRPAGWLPLVRQASTYVTWQPADPPHAQLGWRGRFPRWLLAGGRILSAPRPGSGDRPVPWLRNGLTWAAEERLLMTTGQTVWVSPEAVRLGGIFGALVRAWTGSAPADAWWRNLGGRVGWNIAVAAGIEPAATHTDGTGFCLGPVPEDGVVADTARLVLEEAARVAAVCEAPSLGRLLAAWPAAWRGLAVRGGSAQAEIWVRWPGEPPRLVAHRLTRGLAAAERLEGEALARWLTSLRTEDVAAAEAFGLLG
ncbi:hypothetical protein [Thermaerobacter litoralis]